MAKVPEKEKAVVAKKTRTKKPLDAAADKTRSYRSYLSQEDIPAYELDEAILVAKALLQE